MEALESNLKYKELYVELAELLTKLDCKVCDQDFLGYCFQTKLTRAFIVIKPDMSYKDKYLTLCHEAGHLFFIKNNEWNWSKKPKTEEEANQFALKLLKFNEIDENEYRVFYNKALRKVKKRNKSWFEI